jgi:hypothetical protein
MSAFGVKRTSLFITDFDALGSIVVRKRKQAAVGLGSPPHKFRQVTLQHLLCPFKNCQQFLCWSRVAAL